MSNEMESLDEMDVLLGDEEVKDLVINGETLEIKTVKGGRIPKVAKAMRPFAFAVPVYLKRYKEIVEKEKDRAAAAEEAEKNGVDFTQESSLGLDLMMLAIDLLADHGDDVFDFAAVALNKPRAWFDEVEVNDCILIADAWIAKNADFFMNTVIPMLPAVKAPQSPSQEAGQTQSPSSEEQVTPETKSETTA